MTLATFPKLHKPISILAFPFPNLVVAENKTASGFQFPEIGFLRQPAIHYYGDKVQLTFNILPEFFASFALVRGLIEFNRSRHLNFEFDHAAQNFAIELDVVRMSELVTLLQNVHGQLVAEVRFKAALKKAIQFEKQYKQQCEAVYSFTAAVTY